MNEGNEGLEGSKRGGGGAEALSLTAAAAVAVQRLTEHQAYSAFSVVFVYACA